jgi:hypothetical protein
LNPPLRLLTAFQQHFDKPPDEIVGVEGRDMWVAGDITGSGRWLLHAPDLAAQITFDTRSARAFRSAFGRPLPPWARYIAGVCAALDAQHLLGAPGGRLVMVGDEPPGPRYEYAMGMAFATLYLSRSQHPELLLPLMETVQKQVVP